MNYEEKYTDFLDKLNGLLEDCEKKGHIIARVEDIRATFPELKESEDERIRKGLIKAVSGTMEGNTLFGTDITREEALAWLEKQKPVEWSKEDEEIRKE